MVSNVLQMSLQTRVLRATGLFEINANIVQHPTKQNRYRKSSNLPPDGFITLLYFGGGREGGFNEGDLFTKA